MSPTRDHHTFRIRIVLALNYFDPEQEDFAGNFCKTVLLAPLNLGKAHLLPVVWQNENGHSFTEPWPAFINVH